MPRSIAFRVDASSAIGSGHVVRCATLAERLRARGARVCFVCCEQPGHFCEWLEAQGYAVHRLPPAERLNAEEDALATRQALAGPLPFDWLVVDHYRLDAAWERSLRPAARRILVIDDLADRPHDCDLLLDQNFRPAAAAPYAALAPGARLLLGPRYALLRREFAAARTAPAQRDGEVRRVLVCFGGADPHNHTAAALAALQAHAAALEEIAVVLGAANPHRESVAARCAALPQARLLCAVPDIAPLLARADLAIGAGGTMNWERACLGVPTLAFGIAANQRPGLEALLDAGALIGESAMPSPDAASISAWTACALASPALLRGLARRSAALVDGLGCERVAEAMLPPPRIAFRPATLADDDALHRWRNDPAIRGVSLDPREIEPAAHRAWLEKTLAHPRRRLLIAEREGAALGVVRFDLEDAAAVISVYRVPAGPRGGGLIRHATDWLRRNHPEIRRIVAEVLPDNAASLAAFRNAGYRDTKNVLAIELEKP